VDNFLLDFNKTIKLNSDLSHSESLCLSTLSEGYYFIDYRAIHSTGAELDVIVLHLNADRTGYIQLYSMQQVYIITK